MRLEDSKTGPRTVWLGPGAARLVAALPRRDGAARVFPEDLTSARLYTFWVGIREEAGLAGLRIHDARHTYASQGLMNGVGLATVGKLLGRETLAGLAAADNGETTASAGRLEAELGYGIAMFDGGFTGTPHLGVGLSETGRDYRLGWRLTSARKGDPGFEIGLDATRREAANADAEHGVMLRGAIRW